MFENVSPLNRIVVSYKKEDFVFLGARSMQTGKIYLPNKFDHKRIIVPCTLIVYSVDGYLNEQNVEGVVVTMPNGLMFKVKSDTCMELHGSNIGASSTNIKVYVS